MIDFNRILISGAYVSRIRNTIKDVYAIIIFKNTIINNKEGKLKPRAGVDFDIPTKKIIIICCAQKRYFLLHVSVETELAN